MKTKILGILKENRNEYVSGQDIGERLGVTRNAIWKAVSSLKEMGYSIESVTNKGYRLTYCPDILCSEEISGELKTRWWGNEILYFDSIDSTNNEIKRQAEKGAREGLLAIAEQQTAGRGRRGKEWSSPPGSGIWMSFLLRPDITPYRASQITIVTALAAANAIRNVTGLNTLIKWPNDIVIDGKKVTGILTEMSTEIDSVSYVVVGIGINVNTESFPPEIGHIATSLVNHLPENTRVQRSGLVAAFGSEFERLYDKFLACDDLSPLKAEYEARLVNIGREIIIMPGEQRAKALGINNDGELLVEDEQGVKAIRSGEVSVRGVYGYV